MKVVNEQKLWKITQVLTNGKTIVTEKRLTPAMASFEADGLRNAEYATSIIMEAADEKIVVKQPK